jgi:hypothetical protein
MATLPHYHSGLASPNRYDKRYEDRFSEPRRANFRRFTYYRFRNARSPPETEAL